MLQIAVSRWASIIRLNTAIITGALFYRLIGRIHGAIVATTVGAIVARRSPAYTRGDCRGDRRDNRRCDSHPVYTLTLQEIVAATNTCLIEQPTGDCRRDDRL